MIVIRDHREGCDQDPGNISVAITLDEKVVAETKGQVLNAASCMEGFVTALSSVFRTNDGNYHVICAVKKCACGTEVLASICEVTGTDLEDEYQHYLNGWKIAQDGTPEPTRITYSNRLASDWYLRIDANERMNWVQNTLAKLFGNQHAILAAETRWGS